MLAVPCPLSPVPCPLSPVPCPLSPVPCPLQFVPITPAHAAAAWPLHAVSRRLPLAALVIGTFSPDLEYLVNLRPVGKFGHSPVGLVVFCIPATLLLYWGWRALVRPALAPLLPGALGAALVAPEPGRRTDVVPLAIVAALLGAASHVFWDGFTHGTGWGVALIPFLSRSSPRFQMQWFTVAQYASSVAGVLVILLWIALTLRRFPARSLTFAPGQPARLAFAALFVTVVTFAVAAANASVVTEFFARLARAAVGAELGFALGLALYALYARSRPTST
ncbi:protein of unknown function [bacterium JGI 053]|nr:protein of unknown function [bacterium JGI 053]